VTRRVRQFRFPFALFLVEAVAADAGSVVIASLCLVADIEDLIARAGRANGRVVLVAEDSDSLNCYRSTGAAGIVHRSTSASTFRETLRKIRMGADFVLPAEGTRRPELGRRLAASLTPGELKILALLLEGCKNRRIAEYLDVAEHVVRSSFQQIFDKTGFL
jgi:DNA-binding NarL/FixJ family response regulator